MISGTAAGVVLGFLLSTAYGAGFHFVVGGPPRKIALYVIAAWLGFLIGHVIGDLASFHLLKLGAVNLLSASLGAWLALVLSRWLSEWAPRA
ncbi:MAG: hypothetical protein R3300_18890 [Candidatus Promineifilaceae bacterium]|nr:hypothetical protein [Candidatus Promineifilaceae bacterium]